MADSPQHEPLYTLVERLRACLAVVDEQEGEVGPALDAELDALGLSFERKVEAYAGLIQVLDAEAAGCASLEARYAERKRAKLAQKDRLRGRMYEALKALEKRMVATATATVTIQATQAKLVLKAGEIEIIQAGFAQTVVSVDRQRLRAAVEAKEADACALAELQRGESLTIRS